MARATRSRRCSSRICCGPDRRRGAVARGSSLFGVLKVTAERGAREILLVEAQEEFVRPSRIFTAQALGSAGAEPDTPAIAPSEAPPLSHDDYVVGPIGVPSVFHLDRLDLSFVPKPWAWAEKRRAEIDALFADMRRKKPALWNGRVLLMHRQVIEHGVLRGEFIETDYASFVAWKHQGRPQAEVRDCFSAAAIQSSDGAFLLGVMGAHTFNAGRAYFPCGTPDPDDIVGGKVDFEHSVRRELLEETGLAMDDFTLEPGWTMVVDGSLIGQIKVLRARECRQGPARADSGVSRAREEARARRYPRGLWARRFRPGHAALRHGVSGLALCHASRSGRRGNALHLPINWPAFVSLSHAMSCVAFAYARFELGWNKGARPKFLVAGVLVWAAI